MEPPQLTESARRFLVEVIGSLERLDILLVMHHHEGRWWTAATLACELRMPAATVEEDVNALGRQNLINVRLGEHVLYRFDPGTSELRQLVEEIVNVHYANRGAVAAVISSPGSSSARLFADAFRLWKDPNHG